MTTAPRSAEGHAAPVLATQEPAGQPIARVRCETCGKPLTDELTGVLDRHEWDRRAAHALLLARRRRRPLALILADLDGFKGVNDTYGHVFGDAVLCAVAGALNTVDGAVVGRYGRHTGDEFLVLLPGATAGDALTVAHRLQTAVRGLSVSAPSSRCATATLTGQTVSMGVAAGAPTSTERWSLADLLLDADVALRSAKRAGGDLACTADRPTALPVPPASPEPAAHRSPPPVTGTSGELRIPLASFGSGDTDGPAELVLSPAAAQRLHAVLTELLGGSPAASAAP